MFGLEPGAAMTPVEAGAAVASATTKAEAFSTLLICNWRYWGQTSQNPLDFVAST